MVHDFCVIGGGILGLATAMALLNRYPGARLVLLEKERTLCAHQTGHNSGVIHSGIYYPPGSLKSRLCRAGAETTKTFCREHGVAFEICGKLLVATIDLEPARMDFLEQRARDNGIAFERVGRSELHAMEPRITGLGALLVPETGIVDYVAVCTAMAAIIEGKGGQIRRDAAVTSIREAADGVTIGTAGEAVRAGRLIACAGLQSDRLARMAGLRVEHRVVP